MMRRVSQLVLVACVVTSSGWAATDPLVGTWKVNPSRSTITDEMKIEAMDGKKYRLTFGPGQVDSIVADGTDQPALQGTTLSITVEASNKWKVVRKMNGRTLLTAYWTLSEDGKTLNDAFTQYLPSGTTLFSSPLPDGSTLFLPYVYKRTTGTLGFVGTWDSDSAKVKAGIELQIQPDKRGGLTFKRSDEDTAKRIMFDGNDYPDVDPNGGKKGTSSSGRRVNERSLEITEKSNGEIIGVRHIALSNDLNTLTVTMQLVGQHMPQSVLVYDRQ
jgi:hypothetical protein